MQWYLKVLKEYANFRGRARRTEFWMFTLISIVISIVLSIIDSLIGWGSVNTAGGSAYFSSGPLYAIYTLAVLIPTLAVGARRLHDTGRTGWWQLIGIIPLIGWIVLIVFFALDGNPGANQHGPNPKEMAMSGYPAGPGNPAMPA